MENKVLQTADVSIEEMIEKLQKVSGGGAPQRMPGGGPWAAGPTVSPAFLLAAYKFQGTIFGFSEGGDGWEREKV